ncbi:unnamed protein product [Cyclocybe aegerita]|uniref:C2H2-type domain-containing protein n=1 Tax=Cyclocybe aegerita TaxID=1973307 RepID=A0A8S0VZU1_CYCAE|nr:unnamed protein product [Cyclocybe aegerita]
MSRGSQNDYNTPVGSAWASWNSASRADDEVGPYSLPTDHVSNHGSSTFAPSWGTHYVSGQSMMQYLPNPVMQHEEYATQTDGRIQGHESNMNPLSTHNFRGSGFDPRANCSHPSSSALVSCPEFSRLEPPARIASQQPGYNLSSDYYPIVPSQFYTEVPTHNWQQNGQHAPGSRQSFQRADRIEPAMDPAPRPQVSALLSVAEIQHRHSGSMQCKLHLLLNLKGLPSRTAERVPAEALCNAELTTVGELLRHLKHVHDITGNHARAGACSCAWPGCGKQLKEASYLRHVLTHCICWVCPVRACLKTAPRYEALLVHFERCHPGLSLAGPSSSQYSYADFKTAVDLGRLFSDA